MTQTTKVDINLYQGADKTFVFTLYTDVAQTIPWNLTGATPVTLSARKSLDGEAVLFSVNATDGQNGSIYNQGKVGFLISSSNSALLDSNGVYDVFATLAGKKYAAAYGDILLVRKCAS